MGQASKRKAERRTSAPTPPSQSRTWVFTSIIVAVIVLGGGLIAFVALSGGSSEDAAVIPPEGTQVVDPETLSRQHVESPAYQVPAPSGGEHLGIWLNCGVYDTPQPTGNIVHSLEHGAAWVSYSPDLGAEDVDKIRDLAKLDPFVIVSPNPDLPAGEIDAVAWGYSLPTFSADDPRLAEFVTMFARGPQTPEPGATCSGGVGRPI